MFCAKAMKAIAQQLELPDSYLAYDLESLGFAKVAFIVETAHAFYEEGQEVASSTAVLDWSIYAEDISTDFHYYLRKTRDDIKEKGVAPGLLPLFEYSYIVENGLPAKETLRREMRVIETAQRNGWWLLGTSLSFDERVLKGNLQKYLGIDDFSFDWDKVIDVGLLYRAACIGLRRGKGQTLKEFYKDARYKASPSGDAIKWSAELLVSQFAPDCEIEHHRALNDCRIMSLVYQKMLSSALSEPDEPEPEPEKTVTMKRDEVVAEPPRRAVRKCRGIL